MKKTFLLASVVIGLSAISPAAANFAGSVDAKLTLTAGTPLVSYIAPTLFTYADGTQNAPGVASGLASASVQSSLSGVPTLLANASDSGSADANGSGYADVTTQGTGFSSFSLINRTNATINYTLHLEVEVKASGSADTPADFFYTEAGYTLARNSISYYNEAWGWAQFGPGSVSLGSGPHTADINGSLFAGQTVNWSLHSTVNGYAQSQSVPEPASMSLLGLGAAALLRRRAKKA